jgi:hypothetical protein
MGSPTIFSGRYTKLLTQKGLLQQGGAVNQYDGLRNYIKNSSFESNTDEGWNRVKTTISGNLPTGTPTIGKVIAVAPSISSFGPFSGSAPFDTYALRFGNIISTVVAGEGVISDAFTVDPGDRGKVLTFKLYYQSDAGASTDNWSGVLGSQTWAVYIYDQTAGAWLQPTGFLGMNQNSGVGVVSGTFQSSVVAGQQYRIAVIALRNTTSTSALQIDDVYVGPQTAPIGPVVTDFRGYAPATTGFSAGTTPNINVIWRRVGDSIHIIGTFIAGGTGIGVSGDMEVFLPSGLSFDTSKIGTGMAIGAGEVHNAGAYRYSASAVIFTSTSFKISARTNAATGGNFIGTSVPDASWWNAANDQFSFELMAPVAGWSSSVQMSNDTDTRVVAARYRRATDQSIPNGGSGATIVWNSQTFDTHSMMNTSSGVVTIPVSGFYRYTIGQRWANAAAGIRYAGVTFTGVNASKSGTPYNVFNNNGDFVTNSASDTLYFNAGDTMSVYGWQNSGAPLAFQATDAGYFEIERLSGPSVIAATETVAMSAKNASGQLIPNLSSTTITGWTKDYDTHSAFDATSGVFTVPVSGKYQINAGFLFANGALGPTGTQYSMQLQADFGSGYSDYVVLSGVFSQASITTNIGGFGSASLSCKAGDKLRLQVYQVSGAAKNLIAGGIWNYCMIQRTGN